MILLYMSSIVFQYVNKHQNLNAKFIIFAVYLLFLKLNVAVLN